MAEAQQALEEEEEGEEEVVEELFSVPLRSDLQESTLDASETKSILMESQVRAVLEAEGGKGAVMTSWNLIRQKEKALHFGSIVVKLKIHFLKNNEPLEKTYVLKHNPNFNPAFTAYVTMLFNKEISFYKKLKPLLLREVSATSQTQLSIPRCIFTALKEGREIIILEDLNSHGFQNIDRKKGMDVAHASLVLEELARIHATSILLKKRLGPDEMRSQFDFLKRTWWNYMEGAEEMFIINMEGHLDIATSVLQKLGGHEAAANWVTGLKPNILQMIQGQTKDDPPFDVLCHADCTISNFLFRYNGDQEVAKVVVLDFQMCLHASLAIDLSSFFFCCLEGPIRRANHKVFLDVYYQAFSRVLKAAGQSIPFSFNDLAEEYEKKILYGAIMAILVVPLLAAEEEEDAPSVESIVDDTSFLVQRQDKLRKSLCLNGPLRTRFLDIFRDLTDHGIIHNQLP
ncbi:uncharacterized oxidoreductase dhs-27-like [Macrobrachium rosenbergii]|uniref:uncharacterized oxidoreductase dhs-27-like n=1 Tax=Macrobrachium rosenbergii TaxID=79674 RepID=UPI0034D5F01D